jgi:hypothetical protein
VSDATIVLAVRGGFTPRFLLRTDIIPTLRRHGIKVVVLSPNAEEPYFRREFARDGVTLEPLATARIEDYAQSRPGQQTLRSLRLQVLSDRADLTTIDQMMAINEETARRHGLRGRVVARALRPVTRVARRSARVRSALVKAESALFAPTFHEDVYKRYKPALTVVTSLGFSGSEPDNYIMREAHRWGAKVVSIILSWDNTSSKGLRGGPVDHVVAWTEVMKQELVQYHDLDPGRITVCGPPHFDAYYRPPRLSRAELFQQLGLDPERRLLTFGTKSPTNYPWNEEIAEIVARAIAEDRLVEPCQLLLRLHPIYYRQRGGVYKFAASLERARALVARFPNVKIDEPEIVSRTLALDMPTQEMDKLVGIVRHSSVLINVYSTLNLEAAIVDTPCVNVSFNGGEGGAVSIRADVALDEAQPHNQRIVKSGGVAVVRDADALIDAINAYLKDPGRDRAGRRLIREQECGAYPGRAGEAIGDVLADLATR